MNAERKRRRMDAIATDNGVIAAVAMDQRRSLRGMIARAAGTAPAEIPDERISEFKACVTSVMSAHASAVLLDPEYGIDAAGRRAQGCGLLLAYESDGYENPRPHRMLALLPGTSVASLRATGADAIKVLLSWSPDEDESANDRKREMVAAIGEECEREALPFLLEPVVYDPAGAAPRSPEFAKRRPELVVRTMEEFAKGVYRVDLLKVEFPVIAAYVEGSPVYEGSKLHSMAEALRWFRAADSVARQPYIYLSAGAAIAEFLASLQMAAEAGARFSGVLCGRALWQDGIPAFVEGGGAAFSHWLSGQGIGNAQRIAECLKAARPYSAWLATGDA